MLTHAIEARYRNCSPVEAELIRVEQIHQLADVVVHNCVFANRTVVRKFHCFTKALCLLIQPEQDVNLYTLAKPEFRVGVCNNARKRLKSNQIAE